MDTSKPIAHPFFIENESLYGFEHTVELLSAKITEIGWKISMTHDLQETLRKNGKDVLPVKVIELCKPDYSVQLLKEDSERIYSSLMPCRISVYTTTDGKTHISRMNSQLLASQIGGVVEKVMGTAFADIENILKTLIRK